MRPEQKSLLLLGVTRSKAKMLEYSIPDEHHIKIVQDPAKLFSISIAILGDLATAINRNEISYEELISLQYNLIFSARFFDSFLQSKLNESIDPYLLLLGSASYYLCDYPGSALVLANKIIGKCPNLDCEGLEDLLLWLIQSNFETYFDGSGGAFGECIDGIYKKVLQYFENGTGEERLLDLTMKLRAAVYIFGTPRQLLFGDVIAAVVKKKLENSVWKALPIYSGHPREKWLSALQKESFIKELWPAQHLLGKAEVLRGKSAIIQMPTSAGKTKAIELIIRSAFIANSTTLAIIIAPFRALCREIKNSLVWAFHNEPTEVDELSDALQMDFDISELHGHQQILVVTPEKLLYVLRHNPELASHIGLLFFDEGHQFDSGTRGITYELLLTSLRSVLPEKLQRVLLSAVISNAKAVGEWLNGEPNVVEGANLNPTFRSVGFASWLDRLGRIEFVDSNNVEQSEFYVPRVIERLSLGRQGKERIDRFFPDKSDGQAIALYLGLKLMPNGSVAIFCGTKSTAASVCEKAIENIKRGMSLTLPQEFSDQNEVERLRNLHIENLGVDAPASQSAGYGIFTHHGNTPHGIRLAVEYAMREGLVRFVVCTSTLAQGVNLPIRYLIVTSVYQGVERIKVRDFHNLIGRAGRAGMHTEGSIIFADPTIYDKRKVRKDKWRWRQVKELLNPRNSEPCISNLLSIFKPIKSDDEKYHIQMKALDFAKAYINDPDKVVKLAAAIAERHGNKGFSQKGVEVQVAWRINLICSLQSFLLAHWDETEKGLSEEDLLSLAEGTLAFFLADSHQKEHIRQLFQLLYEDISKNITTPARRKIYSRTLYGIHEAQAIESWVYSNADEFPCADVEEILDFIWPLLSEHIKNSVFKRFDKPDVLKAIVHGWIGGTPFNKLLEIVHEREARMIWGSSRREFKIDQIVEVCENAFAYEGALLVGALYEFLKMLDMEEINDRLIKLQLLQKRLKYGLPTESTITLYELGFSDRVIAQDMGGICGRHISHKKDMAYVIRRKAKKFRSIVNKYPAYYNKLLVRYIGN